MRRPHHPRHILSRAALTVLALLCIALDAQASAVSALNLARNQFNQWVQLEADISREQRDWRVEKHRLAQLLKTLRHSNQTLTEKGERLRQQTSRADEQRLALVERKNSLQERHKALHLSLKELGQALAEGHGSLPEILQKDLAKDFQSYVFNDDPEQSLVKRLSGLTRIVAKIERFDRKVSTHSGLLPLTEEEEQVHQVDLLYMGLDHVFYIDQTGRYAGYGWRSTQGWQWQSAPSLVSEVRRAVAIAEGRQAEKFVTLPFPVETFNRNGDTGGSP